MANIRPLSEVLQKKAVEELNEDPEKIEKELEAFREWIKKSPHITCRTDDDQFLINFLRVCKYRMERVKEKFDLYHTLKTHMPEFTRNRDPSNEKMLGLIRKGIAIPLPNLESPDGPRLFLYRLGCVDPSETSIQDLIKVIGILGELIFLDDDNFIVAGQVGIFDYEGFTLSHLSLFNPVLLRKLTMIHQEGSALREQGTHLVNLPSIALTTFNLVLSFLKEKNRKRVRVLMLWNPQNSIFILTDACS